jgi:hypothetical protein
MARLRVAIRNRSFSPALALMKTLGRCCVGLPDDAVLYFEGGEPDAEVVRFMARHSIPEQAHISIGTTWPRPQTFHVPARPAILAELTGIMSHHAEPELAVHFHVYRGTQILLQWYDAFCVPLLLNGTTPEEEVVAFARRIGAAHWDRVEPGA